MRYYLLAGGSDVIVPPHIIAEVVRDISDDLDQREESLAGLIAGVDISILTLSELFELPGGTEALRAWKNGNDVNFYLDSARQLREEERATRRHLSLVEDEPDQTGMGRPEWAKHLLERSAFLQLKSAELIARAEELHDRMLGRVPEKGGVGAGVGTPHAAARAQIPKALERVGRHDIR